VPVDVDGCGRVCASGCRRPWTCAPVDVDGRGRVRQWMAVDVCASGCRWPWTCVPVDVDGRGRVCASGCGRP